MEELKKHKITLIKMRALFLFFYNWKSDEMAKLNKICPQWEKVFKQLDQKLRSKEGITESDYLVIGFEDLYNIFSIKLGYKYQAVVLDFAYTIYGKEANKSINFALYFIEKKQ